MAEAEIENAAATNDLSALLIVLLKGVIYRDADARSASLWNALLKRQGRVRDFVALLALELVLDESEGYAFLRARPESEGSDDAAAPRLPRLVARRPLSFPVSLLLALLRKKLAEFDARLAAYLALLGAPAGSVADE